MRIDQLAINSVSTGRENLDRMLPGQGILDLAALFGRIEEYGYEGYFSIEMFDRDLVNMPVEQSAKLMYQSLLTLIAE